MGGLIFLVLVGIIILGLWLYRKALSGRPADDQPPLIRIPCQDGYIIGYYQSNRLIGQRFDNNRLASEGVFVNGLQVGSGKEYYQGGRLKYEGNFSNGLASGLGKLYEENGRLKYIGNFTNGYAAGQGRIFDQNGKLKYEGQFARLPGYQEQAKDPSAPQGSGREYYDNGQLKYQGEFVNGVWHGHGSSYDRQGRLIFRGQFAYGKPVK